MWTVASARPPASAATASRSPEIGLKRRTLLAAWLAASCVPAWSAAPALMLARSFRPGLDLGAYWVSEKYDGMRGYWDGQRLLSRGGEVLNPPAWFTAGWPVTPMDGELWAGRGEFEKAVSTVRDAQPDDAAWRQLRFMVFDLPAHPGVFDERLKAYQALVAGLNQAWVVAVPQEKIGSEAELQKRLEQVVRTGAEGLMLHRGDAPYRAERNDDLIKLKPFEDAEARVLAHLPGQGRHKGRMGALLVETPAGLRFRIGTGFSDAQREQPPAVGAWISFRYRGNSASGVPRFASFLRERSDWNPPARP